MCNALASTLRAHCAAAFKVHVFCYLQHATGDTAPGSQSCPNGKLNKALCINLGAHF